MKNYSLTILSALCAMLGICACQIETDQTSGGTQIQDMAGFWDVRVDAVNADGTLQEADPYDAGVLKLMTYNTVDDVADRMWINLDGADVFYNLRLIVPIDYVAKSFACNNLKRVEADEAAGNVTITDGKVLHAQGHNLHGLPTDSIVFTATISDDANGLTYRISGTRHSGFTE